MPLYQYTCLRGHITEKLGGLEETSALCLCGDLAFRQAVNHFAIVGSEPIKETRSDVRSFQEASAEVDYHYTKAENDGMPVKRSNLWKQAKRKGGA